MVIQECLCQGVNANHYMGLCVDNQCGLLRKGHFCQGGLAVKSARGFIVLFGITFVNALIKTLVAESHNKDNVEVKHASFDLAMKNQVNTMNVQLPIRIDEYTICVEVSNTVLESVWILPLLSFMLYFSVYLRPLPRRRRWWQQTMMALATEK